MTTADVCAWLKTVNLAPCIAGVRDNGIQGSNLVDLKDDMVALAEMGIQGVQSVKLRGQIRALLKGTRVLVWSNALTVSLFQLEYGSRSKSMYATGWYLCFPIKNSVVQDGKTDEKGGSPKPVGAFTFACGWYR